MKQNVFSIVAALIAAAALFVWFGCRIEPGNGEIAVLIRKTGKPLAAGEIIARNPGEQGIQPQVLGEGRYFRNPYVWDWEIFPVTEVPAGKFAVLVRKFGEPGSDGSIIAKDENSKGVVREVLGTGRHRINPYAYEVKLFDDIKIMPGTIGVVTSLTGNDIFSGTQNDYSSEEGFLVSDGRKGVIKEVLKEGTHRINPFIYSVTVVNTRRQRHEFSGKEAITFLTMDGFPVAIEGTVEFNIDEKLAPRLTQVVGDMEDILNKIILPSVRGFARIEGSKKQATEFIVGESRRLFQEKLDALLKNNCRKWGIEINSVLIRDIIAPQTIAGIIRNRELAHQEAVKYDQEIIRARSEAELAKQKMLAEQNLKKVAAETEKLTASISARQRQSESLVAAETELKVAEINYQTALADAAAKLKEAAAEKDIIAKRNESEAEVLRRQVEAYGNGAAYVQSRLWGKIMPGITTIISNGSAGGSFGLPEINSKGGAK
ncbi:MAG: hypothetical protein J6R00_00755 [Lentisphaeria bacterium]|nr:hypothetical protein [Lentisphaeria bacterium]